MNTQKYTKERLEMINELNSLLRQAQWDTQTQIYLDGEKVSLLIDPLPAETSSNVHVPITVIASTGRADELEGARMTLQQVNDNLIHYGHLNRRGQLLLRELPTATYQIDCAVTGNSNTTLQQVPELTAETKQRLGEVIETMPLQTFVHETAAGQLWQLVYHSADGILKTIIQQQAGDSFKITFESSNQRWDGALLAFTWQPPYARITQRVEPLLRFAVMCWNEAKHLCTTEFNLNTTAWPIELGVPVRAYPPEQLTDELAQILHFSIQGAVTEQARQGWQRLTNSAQLSIGMTTLIQTALSPAPISIWRMISETVFELVQELQIQIGEQATHFIQFPATLTPQLVIALGKLKGSRDEATQRQTLTLPLAEHDLALTLLPNTAGRDQTTTLGIVVAQHTSAAPMVRVLVTLRDSEKRTLESGLTSPDGRMDFANLNPGVYRVEVKYQGTTIAVAVRLTPGQAAVETP